MEQNYRKLLPTWVDTEKNLDLVLSDDIDSLATCALLKEVKGWDIKYFYDFYNVYASLRLKEDINHLNDRCWVDVATHTGKSFDNHVSMLTIWDNWNPDMVNLNVQSWVTNENYCDKYAGSTLLMVWSIFNFPLPKTEEGKMLLLCADSSFLGFYDNRFHDTQKHYLVDILEFYELYDVIKRHTKDEFEELIINYRMKAKIKMIDGELHTNLPLDRIGKTLGLTFTEMGSKFFRWKILEQKTAKITTQESLEDINKNIKTLAFTYKNQVKYSVEIKRGAA